uniref:DNA polymerase processivity factor n=1 Tax=Human herpesvirus 3 TaxID=10335 RepID=A0A4D6FBK1_HHV3|nr:ORF16 [Human alphaherpesvirus 3]
MDLRSRTDDALDMESHAGFDAPEIARAVLTEKTLTGLISSISPLVNRLRDSILIFSDEGLIIHCSLETEQLYIPIPANMFDQYNWTGPRMVVLAATEGRSSLIDAFRHTKDPSTPTRLYFKFTGQPPERSIIQTMVWQRPGDCGPDDQVQCYKQVVKRELACYTMMFPNLTPDISICLKRDQFTRLQRLLKTFGFTTCFILTATDMYIQTAGGGFISFNVSLDINGSKPTPYNLIRSITNSKRILNNIVYGSGSMREFGVLLETHSGFRSAVQNLKLTRDETCYINFYLALTNSPMVGLYIQRSAPVHSFFYATFLSPKDLKEKLTSMQLFANMESVKDEPPLKKRRNLLTKRNEKNTGNKMGGKLPETTWQEGIGIREYCVAPPVDPAGTLDYSELSRESDVICTVK